MTATVRVMPPRCARVACSAPAASLLRLDRDGQIAYLESLVANDHEDGMLLCQDHTDSLRMPLAWQLVDERGSAPSLIGPDRPIVDESLDEERPSLIARAFGLHGD